MIELRIIINLLSLGVALNFILIHFKHFSEHSIKLIKTLQEVILYNYIGDTFTIGNSFLILYENTLSISSARK